MKTTLLASAVSPFAHLLARSAAKSPTAAKAEDDDKDKKVAKAEADDEDMTDEEKRKKRNRDAGRDEDDDGDDGDAKKGKKAKAKAEGDADSDDEDEGDASAKAIRNRERARCAAIFADPAAAKRPDMAAQLAFATSMNRTQAITTLRAIAAGEREAEPVARTGVHGRMSTVKDPDVGTVSLPSTETDPAKATADMIINAGKRRRGETV